ncbi:putative membrane protein [Mycolicibacterium rhodesiae NBB3]|uniref:Putative membrane protein n=1 Tax=Mycolicibacterium rhodesiae (strain NBB3) TaxID=710685 RepID=G8RVT9_MYCRN|nr:DoxX family protein [Mycolicibacterium rhodesiae]AEV75522.1 putative membrane protein [Mycolicibacterium rhodesiae NBB3]
MLIRRVARPMLSAAFIARGVDALRAPKPAADAARPTLEGLSKLPDPVGTNIPSNAETVARINAGVQIGGGLLLATGKLPRLASAALALSVVPGSLGAHAFWSESDPQQKAEERRAFLTDISLIGGLIIAAVDTEGKPSLGWRGRRAAHKVSEAVSAALPVGAATGGALADSELAEKVGHGLHAGAERGREFANVARERAPELAELARKRGAEIADVARERGPELAGLARRTGAEIADVARERGPGLAELARKRGVEIVDVTRDRGWEWADAARERAPELAETARNRAADLADTARTKGREQVKQTRKQLKQERKRLSS